MKMILVSDFPQIYCRDDALLLVVVLFVVVLGVATEANTTATAAAAAATDDDAVFLIEIAVSRLRRRSIRIRCCC